MIVALLLVPLAGTLVLGALALRPSTADGPVPRWTAVVVAAVTLALSVALLPGTRAPAPGRAVDPRHEVDVPGSRRSTSASTSASTGSACRWSC